MNKALLGFGLAAGIAFFAATTSESASAATVTGTVQPNAVDYQFFSTNGNGLTIAVDGFDGGPNVALSDPMIRVFEDDGSSVGALTGNLIATNDDGGPGLNSFLNLSTLLAGDYVLAIGQFFLSRPEARTGIASTPSFSRDYIATFTGDVTVPTPALLPGLIGMGVAAFKKQKKEAEV